MQQQILEWKRQDYYFYYSHELDEAVNEEILNWERCMHLALEQMQDARGAMLSVEFHGKYASVHYIEHDGAIFLPGPSADFAHLPEITEETLMLHIFAGSIHEMKGYDLEFIKKVLYERPVPKSLFNNEYDFKRFIGTRIWKNSRLVVQ